MKYIGQEDKKFQEFEKSCLTHKAVAGTIPIYDGFNYLLFRIFEAACQLQKHTDNILVFIVYSHQSWIFNDMPVIDNWIEHNPIEFVKEASDNWSNFLAKKKREKRYRNIESLLEKYIKNLDEIWIIQQESNLDYSLEKIVKLNS